MKQKENTSLKSDKKENSMNPKKRSVKPKKTETVVVLKSLAWLGCPYDLGNEVSFFDSKQIDDLEQSGHVKRK